MYARHVTGKNGEQQAINYLVKQGYTILERNWFMRIGEIDIIARKDDVIYFFEVKTRSGYKYGHPYEAINQHRVHVLRRLGAVYVANKQLHYKALSVGAIGIVNGVISCVPNIDR